MLVGESGVFVGVLVGGVWMDLVLTLEMEERGLESFRWLLLLLLWRCFVIETISIFV